jgi:hypothetical protein
LFITSTSPDGGREQGIGLGDVAKSHHGVAAELGVIRGKKTFRMLSIGVIDKSKRGPICYPRFSPNRIYG